MDMFDCDTCKKHYSPEGRRGRRCGYIPSDRWRPSGLGEAPVLQMYGGFQRLDVCPGYTTQLPMVTETARAWGHWKVGQLQHFYPEGVDPERLDLIESFNAGVAAADAAYLDELGREG